MWHFCGIGNTRKMEKVQERALRFVYKDFNSSYEQLLAKGEHSTLYLTRIRYIATEFYKCMNQINPLYLQEFSNPIHTEYSLRNQRPVYQPKCRTIRYGINSFRYKGSKIWNSLPANIQRCVSLNEFKILIKTWNGPFCKCLMCERMNQ